MRFVVDRFDKRIKGAYPEVDFPINGNFIVKIPSTVSVDIEPDMDLDDLQDKKSIGILAYYPSFSDIIFEDFLNSSGVEVPGSPDPTVLFAGIGDTSPVGFSPHSNILLPYDGTNYGLLTSTGVDMGGMPANNDVIVIWECFEITSAESDVDGVSTIFFNELDPDVVKCELSFDDNVTPSWEQVYHNSFHQMTPTGQWARIRFTNNLTYSDKKVWLGSYSILHN